MDKEKLRRQMKIVQQYRVTISLIVINVLVFLLLEIRGDTLSAEYMYRNGACYTPAIMEEKEYWRLISSVFLHFGFGHLLNNMFIFACTGSRVEDALGHFRFFILYLLAGIGGNLLSAAGDFFQTEFPVSAGASGAIFGVIGALLWIVIRHRGRYRQLTTRGMFFLIALTLYYGFTATGVDNLAHLGGLLTGFVAALLLYRKKQE